MNFKEEEYMKGFVKHIHKNFFNHILKGVLGEPVLIPFEYL